jgi:hypothetical protein
MLNFRHAYTYILSFFVDLVNRFLFIFVGIFKLLLHQLTLEELYEAWGAKGKEESRKNTAVL